MVEFHVLRCSLCQTFQVLQVTKTSKWKCKLCGEKQSIIKVYGQGTGAECRKHVQKLNTLRGQIDQELQDNCLVSVLSQTSRTDSLVNPEECTSKKEHPRNENASRWSHFLEDTEDHEHAVSIEGSHTTDYYVTTDYKEFRQSNKRKRQEMKQTNHTWTKYSSDVTNVTESFSSKPSRTFMTSTNTHGNFEHIDNQGSSFQDLNRVSRNNTTKLSSFNGNQKQPVTSTPQDFSTDQPVCQEFEAEKLSSSTIFNLRGISTLNRSNRETVSGLDIYPPKKNSDKTKTAVKNVTGTSLKWATFLDNGDDESDDENDELYSGKVSGPVFVTSLNEASTVDNLSGDEL